MRSSKQSQTRIRLFSLVGIVVLGAACSAGEEAPRPQGGFFGGDDTTGENVGSAKQALSSALCNDPNNATIVGTAGDDYLLGTPGNDVIFGLAGNDVIIGKGGDDVICGGPGNDNIDGGSGNDELDGGAGYNWVQGGDGDDTLFGGDDGNELQGGAGDDTISGGAGADTLWGGDDDDTIYGGDGDDDILGWYGNDTVLGEGGDDYIAGGEGNDCLDGGEGYDWIYGESGDDNISGGSAGWDGIDCGSGNDTHETDATDDVSACETAGAASCDAEPCPCNTPNSYFEAFVNGNIPYTPSQQCFESSSTSLVVNFGNGQIAAGGEAGGSGSGNWACEGNGGYPGDTGFVTGLTQEVGERCAALIRDQLIAQGVNPTTQCQPW